MNNSSFLRQALLASVITISATPAAQAEWIIGAFAGTAHTVSSDVTLTPATGPPIVFHDVAFRGESFASPIYYGYRVGWFKSRAARVGVEAELIHLKVFAIVDRAYATSGPGVTAKMSDVAQRLSMSHGLNLLLVNVVARRALGATDRVQLMARGGIGPTLPHGESQIGGMFQEQYQWSSPALQASAGVLIHLTRILAATGEYKLTRAVPTIDVAGGGTARIPALSDHLAVGLSLSN